MGEQDRSPFRGSVLASEVGAHVVRRLIPQADVEWFESVCFELAWQPHGGAGLGRSLSECERMTLGHLVRDIDRIKERRKAEGDAIRAAYKR